jgi:site-specific DNA-cytosine methylase
MVFNNKRLVELAESYCGSGAANKFIHPILLKLPTPLLKTLIDGLLSGDGSYRNNHYRVTTISRDLAQSLCLAVTKCYGVCASIEFTERPKTTVICGRAVNQSDTYTVSFSKETLKQANFYSDGDGFVWSPIKSVTPHGVRAKVFNLEILGDNTYTANNAVVHNCQGFSFAGKQLAFDDPRSALFFEYVRLLRACKPRWFLLENVRMKKEHLQVITDQLGVEPIMIDSALVSAQNRKRYYWTNIPGIEQPEDKGILLRDIVHENVDFTHVVKDRGSYRIMGTDKSQCLDANYRKGEDNHGQRTMLWETLAEYIVPFDKTLRILDKEVERGKVGYFRKDSHANRIYYIHDKAVTLMGDNGGGAAKMGQYPFGSISSRVKGLNVNDNGDLRPHRGDARKSGISEIGTVNNLSGDGKASACIASHPQYVHDLFGNVDVTSCQTPTFANAAQESGNRFKSDDKAHTLRGVIPGALFGCITPDREDKRQNGQRFSDGKKFYTLTAQDRHGVLVEGYIRKLTPIECERLQTLPDSYTEGVSRTQRYKALGNGWTVDVIAHILKHIDLSV